MKKLPVIITLLIICLCLFGCDSGTGGGGGWNPGGDDEPPVVLHTMNEVTAYLAEAEGGATVDDPVVVAVDFSTSLWLELTTAIGTGDKYVALDLTRCTDAPAWFPPYPSYETILNFWYHTRINGVGPYYLPKVVSISMPIGITNHSITFADCPDLKQVTLPVGIIELLETFAGSQNLELVILHAVKPPILSWHTFVGNHPNLKIKVPRQSVNAYKTSEVWSEYADRISAI